MEIAGYLGSLRRWWWTLLVATWVAALAGYVAGSSLPRVYEAETRLLVGPFNTDLNTQRASGQLSQTYAELVTSQPFLESVIADLGLDIDTRELQKRVSASPNDVTRLLTIRAQSEDPEVAAAIANALARATDELASGSAGVLRPEGEIQIVDVALPPTIPIAPQVSLIILMSAGAGLVGALLIVLIVEQVGSVIRSADDLAQTAGIPVISTVARTTTPDDPSGEAIAPTRDPPAEPRSGAFRHLSARIVNGVGPSPARSVLVQATGRRDGSAAFAADLAATLAERTAKVALVTSRVFERTVASTGATWLPDPGDLRRSTPDVRLKLIDEFDVTVIHAEPLEVSPAGLVWAPLVDAAVIVAARDRSDRRAVSTAAESLRAMQAPIAGSVLLGPRPGSTVVDRLLGQWRNRLAPDVAGEVD